MKHLGFTIQEEIDILESRLNFRKDIKMSITDIQFQISTLKMRLRKQKINNLLSDDLYNKRND